MPLQLQKMNLTWFRCYETLRLDVSGGGPVVLTGPNGAGKTNILEAVSLLAPGRGLRGAELADMKNRSGGPEDLWAVAAELETADGLQARIGTGLDREGKRRIVRINGREAKSQEELAALVAAVWLTPQMDRLFIEGASNRRRFLDRLVAAHDAEHATRLNRYEKNLRERLKLLQSEGGADPVWLDTLEAQLAAEGVSVAFARRDLLEQLARYTGRLYNGDALFPLPEMAIAGRMEGEAGSRPALEIEDEFRARLRANRAVDAAAGKTLDGTHRSDFIVRHAGRGMPADQCSTGEQKGLLISIVLAHALMMQGERGFVPLLLLDEIAAHLDDKRRDALFAYLAALDGQVFLTGTDAGIFSALKPAALFCEVEAGRVRRMPREVQKSGTMP